MSTFKAVLLKGESQKRNDGTYNIKIRIIHKRKSDYISTDLYIPWNNFDRKEGIAASGDDKDFINMRISEKLYQYRKKDIELGDTKNFMSVKDIKRHLLSGNFSSEEIDFYDFVDNFCQTVTVDGTREQYISFKRSLKRFAGNKLPIRLITLNFLYGYENYLRKNGTKNGIVNYMSTFRSLFRKARDRYNDEDIGKIVIPQYPFAKYEFPKRTLKTKKHRLTTDEMKLFINYKAENDGEQFAKDMSLLMFYLIGIEAKDLFYLGSPVSGRIEYDRFKTGGEFSIKLEPEAIKIINKYKGKERLLNVSERFLHHKSFYRYINAYLHGEQIGKPGKKKSRTIVGVFPKLGMNKQVTTKWFRHTWASIARNECGINKDDIAFCLGHEDDDNRVTDIYATPELKIIDDSNRKVIDILLRSK